MSDALTWTVNEYLMLGVTLALFAFVGLRRGVNRELLSMVGIGVGMIVANGSGPALQPQANRLYSLVRFALGGGLTSADPTAAWARASQMPPLVATSADVQSLSVVVFIFIVILAYMVGQRLFPTPKALVIRFLGLLAGGINGFLVSHYLFPAVLSQPRAVILLPGAQVKQTLNSPQNVAMVVVFFVAVLIAFGLYSAGSSKKK